MEREGKRYSAYASNQMPVMIDLISENDQSKFHSHQAISAVEYSVPKLFDCSIT